MSVQNHFKISLKKQYPNQVWGFRLVGGMTHGQPLIIQKVS